MDSFAVKTLEYGAELSADHPGFTDDAYRKRRAEITAKAKTFRTYHAALFPFINGVLGECRFQGLNTFRRRSTHGIKQIDLIPS